MNDPRVILAILTTILHASRSADESYGEDMAIDADYDLAHKIGTKCGIEGWSRGVEK